MALGRSPAEALAAAERIFLGRYVIDGPLPWNGLAFVFRAVEPGRAVAVAALPDERPGGPEDAAAFRQEALELLELRHPGLVPVTDAGIEQGVPYLEMDFVPGRTLAEAVRVEGPFSRERAFAVADGVLEAMELAHDRRWMHWDLTPTNVVLARAEDGSERPVVIGLGWRSLVGPERAVEVPGSGPQAERFAAPELRNGSPDGRSDLYSAGALLWFMLTGSRPPAPGASARKAGWAQPVVERAMASRSVERFADVRSMRITLRKAFEGQAVGSAARRGLGRPLMWGVAGALCLALGGGAVLGWTQWRQHRAEAEDLPRSANPPARPPPLEPAPAEEEPSLPGPLGQGVPDPLRSVHEKLERGESPSRQELGPLYAYAKQHPDDPRGHLVLGRAFSALGWYSAAIKRYRLAHAASPEARHDPHMLGDLMEPLPHPDLHAPAGQAIAAIYGAEAIAPLERYLAQSELPWVEQRRVLKYLERLKTRVGGAD